MIFFISISDDERLVSYRIMKLFKRKTKWFHGIKLIDPTNGEAVCDLSLPTWLPLRPPAYFLLLSIILSKQLYQNLFETIRCSPFSHVLLSHINVTLQRVTNTCQFKNCVLLISNTLREFEGISLKDTKQPVTPR